MDELLTVMKAFVENQKLQQEQEIKQNKMFARILTQHSTLVEALIQNKPSEHNSSFVTAEAISDSITKFKYCPEDGIAFTSYFRRYADLFKWECEKWTDEKNVRLLLQK